MSKRHSTSAPELVNNGYGEQYTGTEKFPSATRESDKYTVQPPDLLPEVDRRFENTTADSVYMHIASKPSTLADHSEPRKKRTCGVPYKVVVIGGILVGLLVLGCALGAGLGLGLKSRNEIEGTGTQPDDPRPSAASPRVADNTSIAGIIRGDGAGMLLYYQLANGSIVEDFYTNDTFALDVLKQNSPVKATERRMVPSQSISLGSPLSAASFLRDGEVWRSLFYIDNTTSIRTTNSSGLSQNWTNGDVIYTRDILPNSPSFAACYFEKVGLRLYVSLATGYIASAINYFPFYGYFAPWAHEQTFRDLDARAGCTCGPTVAKNDQTVQDVYARSADSQLTQREMSSNRTLEQVQGNSIDLQDIAVRDDSDISITTNGNQTQSHLFYLGTNGTLQQLHQSRSDTGSASVRTVSVLFNTESRFASVWPNNGDSGPLLVYGDVQGGLRVVLLDTDANILANSSIYI